MKVLGLFFMLICTTLASALELAPGLLYRQFTSKVGHNSALEMHELRLSPESPAQFGVFYNPGAHPNAACLQQYGGSNLPELARSPELQNVLGVVNGIVFGPDQSGLGYLSHGMLLSQDKIFSPPQYLGAGVQSFVFWDAVGGVHTLRLRFSPCAAGGAHDLCGVEILEATPELSLSESELLAASKSAGELVTAFQNIFPALRAAFQSNMEISHGGEWSACRPGAAAWKCQSVPRTLLCLHQDGVVSFYTTGPALVHDLAMAFASDCHFLYNLDGGGSTQMGIRESGRPFQMVDGRSITVTPARGCPSGYRPVEHYFGFSL